MLQWLHVDTRNMLAVFAVEVQKAQVAICVLELPNAVRTSQGHLKTYGVSDATLSSEARLLLARAGKLNSNRVTLEFHLTRISTA